MIKIRNIILGLFMLGILMFSAAYSLALRDLSKDCAVDSIVVVGYTTPSPDGSTFYPEEVE